MSITRVNQTPLEHFEWLSRTYPRSTPVELMKSAFNHGLLRVIENLQLDDDQRNWLFREMIGLDTNALDPPLTVEDWKRGP